MLSQTSEYALRAMLTLAERPGERLTTPQIAALTGAPTGYLSKVLQGLARARLVDSHRGVGGGFKLLRPAGEVSLLEIINAVDPFRSLAECPLRLPAHKGRLCALHRRLKAACDDVQAALAEATLAQLVAENAAPVA